MICNPRFAPTLSHFEIAISAPSIRHHAFTDDFNGTMKRYLICCNVMQRVQRGPKRLEMQVQGARYLYSSMQPAHTLTGPF